MCYNMIGLCTQNMLGVLSLVFNLSKIKDIYDQIMKASKNLHFDLL